ncbi:mitochondrial carrier protein [Conidiobolus coronatus NRRL 28638]|uniref:Mitochondrial carrier protein n=1 Tax=Conidiobolus coronatus (strain ATCC 28846 / CBS 209.66 / NRRL 28638) TaxID=796925 RepID=A0A137PC00_CONC2|nr:mitochondrial carrier protein [Conidiobolus coronatus NRRL 28638]|eukprot:KXN72495.1 mitochondrial carrier protein [Conidiobolus coronatus NRRL 28638]
MSSQSPTSVKVDKSVSTPPTPTSELKKRPLSWENIALGAFIQTFEVTTLGQPFEVVKTHMAANRGDSLMASIQKTYARGGIKGFWQGLIPWAWIEASTKGGVLLFASSEIDYRARVSGASPAVAGLLGGMGGGIAQAYTTMGFCTFMKTVEVTRHKSADNNLSTWRVAYDVFKKEGILGLNKGVSAVAIRQMTNWGSRFGISRFTEKIIRGDDKTRKLTTGERLLSSTIGVEMQSQTKSLDRPKNLNIFTAAKYIYEKSGLLGFYRGVTPRICLGVYLTICMVFGGDQLKEYFANRKLEKNV